MRHWHVGAPLPIAGPWHPPKRRRKPTPHGPGFGPRAFRRASRRSEEHTSELQSLMRISYAVFCFKKKTLSSVELHIVRISTISLIQTPHFYLYNISAP